MQHPQSVPHLPLSHALPGGMANYPTNYIIPNIPITDSMVHQAIPQAQQGEPKRKRVQVPSACMQCKRAHAACSNTRPCDRCVRINQASACVNASFALRPVVKQSGDSAKFNNPTTPASTPVYVDNIDNVPPTNFSSNIPFNENDLSRFLFDESQGGDYGNLNEFSSSFETLEGSTGTPEPCMASISPCSSPLNSPATPSSSYSSPSSSSSPTSSTSSTPASTPINNPCCSPGSNPPTSLFTVSTANIQVPPAVIGPSSTAIAATIAATNPSNHGSPSLSQPQSHPLSQSHSLSQSQSHPHPHPHPHSPQPLPFTHLHPLSQSQPTPTAATIASTIAAVAANSANIPAQVLQQHIVPQTTQLEIMMSELLQHNKKMENMVSSMHSEMKSLKHEVSILKQNGSASALVPRTAQGGQGIPATAVWSINEGSLLEHNERFAQIIELSEIPTGYTMQHFFGGPCSKAASARMNNHLSNIQNAQPATDYAVIERKKLNGEMMRLMIVVNVVPTPSPVFITVMYEM